MSCNRTKVIIESSWFHHSMSKHQLSNGFVDYDSCLPLFLQLLLVCIQATCLFTEFFVIHAGLYLYGRMDVHLASLLLHGHMKTIKYLYMQLL